MAATTPTVCAGCGIAAYRSRPGCPTCAQRNAIRPTELAALAAATTRKPVKCWACKDGLHARCAFSSCPCSCRVVFEPATCPHANTSGLPGDRQACDDCGLEVAATRDADGYLVLDMYRGEEFYRAFKAAHPGAYERRS